MFSGAASSFQEAVIDKQEIRTERAAAPGGTYSQGIAAGGFLYTAGTVGTDPATGQLAGIDVGTQTRQALANLTAVLEAAGMDLSNVVKATAHLSDMSDFAAFDAVYRSVMPAPYPVRTTVGSTMLGVLVEIDFVAYRDPNG